MLNRAYSILNVKAFDPDRRVFEGTATSPEPDRVGDVIEASGVTFKNPLPLLLYHDNQRPVGEARFGRAKGDGATPFTAKISKIDRETGTVRERLDEAVDSLSADPPLIRGVSIGFRPLEEPTFNKSTGGYTFTKIEVMELSLVVVPAHQAATIANLKSFDTARPAASGIAPPVLSITQSGVSDTSPRTKRKDGSMSTSERIQQYTQEKAAKVQKLTSLASSDDGTTMTAAQQEEFDTLQTEIDALDGQIKRLEVADKYNKSMAIPVAAATPQQAAESRSGIVQVSIKPRLEKGQAFARYAMCVAACKGNIHAALEMAKDRYPDNQEIHTVLKAAVAAGTTADSTWAGSLVQYRDLTSEFVEFLRSGTIVDRIPGMTRVPPKTRIAVQSTGGSASWVGEGKPKPLTKAGFTTMTIDLHKIATIAVLTEEEVRLSSPSAELKVRNDLANAVIARMDQDFIDPANAGTANVKPASITNGIAAVAPSGATADHLRSDLADLLGTFATNNIDLSDGVVVMSASMAIQLSLMVNTLGNREFPDITVRGGTLLGMPVIVSQYLQSLGSPGAGMIVVFKPSDIFIVDDGMVTIDSSRDASVEMLDGSLTQDGTTGTGASLVSLWQNNLVGLRAERFVTWKRARTTSVAYISNAAYSV